MGFSIFYFFKLVTEGVFVWPSNCDTRAGIINNSDWMLTEATAGRLFFSIKSMEDPKLTCHCKKLTQILKRAKWFPALLICSIILKQEIFH